MSDEKEQPEASEPKVEKRVFVRLKQPIGKIVAGRIVSVPEGKVAGMKKAKLAEVATPKQVAIAGGNIPHIND